MGRLGVACRSWLVSDRHGPSMWDGQGQDGLARRFGWGWRGRDRSVEVVGGVMAWLGASEWEGVAWIGGVGRDGKEKVRPR